MKISACFMENHALFSFKISIFRDSLMGYILTSNWFYTLWGRGMFKP